MNHEPKRDDRITTSLYDVRAENPKEQTTEELSQPDKDTVHTDLGGGAQLFKKWFSGPFPNGSNQQKLNRINF